MFMDFIQDRASVSRQDTFLLDKRLGLVASHKFLYYAGGAAASFKFWINFCSCIIIGSFLRDLLNLK